MSLPEQIQKQLSEAQSIIEQHYGPAEQSAESETPTDEPRAEATSEQAAPVASVPQDTAQAAQQREDENSETYAQRWKSLQGIYNVTVAKAQGAEARVAQLEQLIAAMQSAPAAAPQPSQPKVVVTPEDEETFGGDLVGMVNRVAGGAVEAAMSPVMRTLQALERQVASLNGVVPVVQNVAQQQRYTREERFFADLSKHVPDWERINANGDFHNWLLSADPMTGIVRQTYLADAQATFDVARTVSIFNAWKGATGAAAQPQQPTVTKAVSELERQVAPGRTMAAPVPTTSQGKLWSPQDIAKFYDDVRVGKFKGRDSERTALERDIFDAQREGRIVRNAA